MNFILLLFLPLVLLAKPSPRIVGGVEVSPKFKYSFLVSLLRYDQPRCGGTLITSSAILTAAHCTTGQTEDYQALLHRHDFKKTESEEKARRYDIISRVNHQDYDNVIFLNDISIWRINQTTNIRPLTWQPTAKPSSRSTFTVAGWGSTRSQSRSSSILMEVALPQYDTQTCLQDYQADPIDSTRQLCAGYPEGGRDACQGDSGGPLLGWHGRTPLLIGIVSWGNGCADPHQPGIYTKVSAYQTWIRHQLYTESTSTPPRYSYPFYRHQ